jgi:hypothetical protein
LDENSDISLKDAYWAIIYQEESVNYSYVLSINPEYPKAAKPENLPKNQVELENYQSSKIALDKKIDDRMSYIKKFLPENNKYTKTLEYEEFEKNIQAAN